MKKSWKGMVRRMNENQDYPEQISLWEQNVRKNVPYIAGEQPNKEKMIKLNTNECPYPPAPGVSKAAFATNYDSLRLYPDAQVTLLVDTLAEYYHLNPSQVFVGVGSDDVLAMCYLTFFNSGKPILFPDVTYSFYDVWANLYRIPYKTCPLQEDWHINPADYSQSNGGVIFPNPNAPTGLLEPLSVVEEIIKNNQDAVVIVDEAYVDFGGESAISLIEEYDNLLVVQTFSKSRSMAGLRIGYAMGNEKLIRYLNDAKFSYNSYTMNQPSQVLGVEAVKDVEYFKEIIGKVIRTRERTKNELKKLGFTFPEPGGNFIFASHERVPAKAIYEALKEADIYVRHWDKPRIHNYLRITIGTDEEMDSLLVFLKRYLEII